MHVTRREFIQITGATAAGLAVSGLGFDLSPVKSHAQMIKTKYAKESTTICCYCAVGCGAIVHTSIKDDLLFFPRTKGHNFYQANIIKFCFLRE